MGKNILVIPDVHFPFADFSALRKVYDLAKQLKPDIYVCLGDTFDMYSMSRFPRSHNVITPQKEIETARAQAEEMWERLRKASPRAKAFSLKGNHEDRMAKRVLEKVPELESMIDLKSLFTFPNVELVDEELILKVNGERVQFHHGFFTKIGDHLKRGLISNVHGHTHRPGVYYHKLEKQTLFELDCGHLGNPDSKALSYVPKRISNWVKGVGYISSLGPQFLCLGA